MKTLGNALEVAFCLAWGACLIYLLAYTPSGCAGSAMVVLAVFFVAWLAGSKS